MQLRDGTTTEDPRLDRLVQFDERSRAFPVREAVGVKPIRSYTWRCGMWLDQGQEGACVGFSVAHELAARPAEVPGLDMTFARTLYHNAQRNDPWPGGSYPGASPLYEGTSVLAGVKVAHAMGYFGSYRWAFGLEDVLLGLGYAGPCVIGVNWYEGMMSPNPQGYIRPTGRVVGGHAILVRRVSVPHRLVQLRNSWGQGWGIQGDCVLSWDDLGRLLDEQGEAVFFLGRKTRAG